MFTAREHSARTWTVNTGCVYRVFSKVLIQPTVDTQWVILDASVSRQLIAVIFTTEN